MSQRFHLGDILSITTGHLVSPDHMGGIYRILNHLTGDNLMTHQLPIAAERMSPVLIAQFPELAAIEPSFTGEEHVRSWLAEYVAEYGEWFDVTAPPSALWGEHDAMQELRDMAPHAEIITVEIPDDGGAR